MNIFTPARNSKANILLTKWTTASAIGLTLAATFAALPAQAEYPKRPVQMVIPYGPGGATDISARSLAGPLGKLSPKPLLMVNKP